MLSLDQSTLSDLNIFFFFKLWTDEIFHMAYNLSLINSPTVMFLQKVHTKLTLDIDKSGKIPIKKYEGLYIFHLVKFTL